MGRPPPESGEHAGGTLWRLSLAQYQVMPDRYEPGGWVFAHADPDTTRRRRIYVAGFSTEEEATQEALAHLEHNPSDRE